MGWDKQCSGTPGPIASVASRAIMAECLRLTLASTCASILVRQLIIKRLTVDKMAVLEMVQALSCTSKALFSGPRILPIMEEMLVVLIQLSKIITAPWEDHKLTLSIHQSLRWCLKMRASIRDGRETSNSHASLIRYRTLTWSNNS